MLYRFLILSLPTFSYVSGTDAYDFLIPYEARVHNLGFLKTHIIDYTTFQLYLAFQHC